MDEEVQLVRQKGRPPEEARLTGRLTDIDRSEKGRKCRLKVYCICKCLFRFASSLYSTNQKL